MVMCPLLAFVLERSTLLRSGLTMAFHIFSTYMPGFQTVAEYRTIGLDLKSGHVRFSDGYCSPVARRWD
jgi:hypothetical protein